MYKDWTIEKYYVLLKEMRKYDIITMRDYLLNDNKDKNVLILRHDIDSRPQKALGLARTEAAVGVFSTYYVRWHIFRKDPWLVEKIQQLGHEVGYHFEVLSASNGNLSKAVPMFEYQVRAMREFVDVTTSCMHGDVLSKWNNNDFWAKAQATPKDFGLVGDAYYSIDFNNIHYYSDTGRSWLNDQRKVYDTVQSIGPLLNTTDSFISWLRANPYSSFSNAPVYVLMHPERWARDNKEHVFWYLRDMLALGAKKLLRVIRT